MCALWHGLVYTKNSATIMPHNLYLHSSIVQASQGSGRAMAGLPRQVTDLHVLGCMQTRKIEPTVAAKWYD